MSHPNARLTPLARGELVAEVDAGWPQAEVARRFRVSRATVAKWARRCRSDGRAAVQDRSSRPGVRPASRRLTWRRRSRSCGARRGRVPT